MDLLHRSIKYFGSLNMDLLQRSLIFSILGAYTWTSYKGVFSILGAYTWTFYKGA